MQFFRVSELVPGTDATVRTVGVYLSEASAHQAGRSIRSQPGYKVETTELEPNAQTIKWLLGGYEPLWVQIHPMKEEPCAQQ